MQDKPMERQDPGRGALLDLGVGQIEHAKQLVRILEPGGDAMIDLGRLMCRFWALLDRGQKKHSKQISPHNLHQVATLVKPFNQRVGVVVAYIQHGSLGVVGPAEGFVVCNGRLFGQRGEEAVYEAEAQIIRAVFEGGLYERALVQWESSPPRYLEPDTLLCQALAEEKACVLAHTLAQATPQATPSPRKARI